MTYMTLWHTGSTGNWTQDDKGIDHDLRQLDIRLIKYGKWELSLSKNQWFIDQEALRIILRSIIIFSVILRYFRRFWKISFFKKPTSQSISLDLCISFHLFFVPENIIQYILSHHYIRFGMEYENDTKNVWMLFKIGFFIFL